MNWHQPWLLLLDREQLEELITECRYNERRYREKNVWALSTAWRGLAHEATERAMELYRRENPEELLPGQQTLDVPECRNVPPDLRVADRHGELLAAPMDWPRPHTDPLS